MIKIKIIGMVEGCQILVSNRYLSIVDDESDITMLFHDALKSLPGITIFTFTEPRLALEHFKTNKNFYALVIVNLRIAVINGIQLLKTVKDLNPRVRTVLTTAFEVEDKPFQEFSEKKIINRFAQKPISLVNLLQEASEQLHSYELQKIPASKRLE